jgi:sialate O-acetylesterase
LTNKGEANRDYNTDKYACSLAKMIQNWREIWHERTNGTTNIEFPFGVVQVSSIQNYQEYIRS